MSDVFDAYSVHIYWDYWDTPFFNGDRLKDVRAIVDRGAAGGARKPTYVMEFGVRGIRTFPGSRRRVRLLGRRHGLSRTNIAAFQQLWFDSQRLNSASRAPSSGMRTGAGTTALQSGDSTP